MDSPRKRRIEQEIYQVIGPAYGNTPERVSYETQDGIWVCIKSLKIPSALTSHSDGLVNILLLIPESYPQIPPDGFYCDQGLKIKDHYFSGFRDKHYPQLQQELIQKKWNWFCAHAHYDSESTTWRASSNIQQGDNLLRYLHLCLAILEKEAKRLK